MRLFAVSDLHLSGRVNKPMNVFGNHWTGHFERIKTDWNAKVREDDVVLIAGDISWAMRLEDGVYDLHSLAELKGKKVFIRGNHDYWWSGIQKVRDSAPDDTFYFLQNDAVKIGNYVICGSRGWTCPGSTDYTDHDEKLYKREAERFKLCFQAAKKLQTEGDKLIVMIHYPPFGVRREDTLFTRMFEENGADMVVYGHIHSFSYYKLKTTKNDIIYYLTACDQLGFRLALLEDDGIGES